MKKILQKKTQFDEIFLIRSALILLLLCVFFLIYINANAILFQINGFLKLTKNPLQVYFLDVGQANATFIVLPNDQTMLIDTGSEESSVSLVKDIDWILRKNKLSSIDFLVLTHSDADHVGGAEAVLKNFDVNSAFRPKLLSREEMDLLVENNFQIVYTDVYNTCIKTLYSEPNCNISFVEDLHMQMGAELFIDFFACENTDVAETNYYSPFIVMEYQSKTFMFTADATATRETEFLQMLEENQLELKVDFLLVAHHGSKYSSSRAFLEEISPKFAFVSAGDASHPAQEVKKRLKDVGVNEIFVTKEVGTIGIGMDERSQFVIRICKEYIDLPCIVVVLSVGVFVAVFFIGKSHGKSKFGFSIKRRQTL